MPILTINPTVLSLAQTTSVDWHAHIRDVAYLIAAVLFIIGLKMMSSPRTARRGNTISGIGMLLAIAVTLQFSQVLSLQLIIGAMAVGSLIGAIMAYRTPMTGMPQMVGLLNGFGGLASVLVSVSQYLTDLRLFHDEGKAFHFDAGVTIGLGVLVGGVTFTGSLVAFGKLQGLVPGKPVRWPLQLPLNALMLLTSIGCTVYLGTQPEAWWAIALIVALGGILGITLVLPIGGADMPVVIALLNSYSGIAGAMTGFVLSPPNKALIVSGSLVGASGIILCAIMCKAMNRSLTNVLFGGMGGESGKGAGPAAGGEARPVRSVEPDELAMLLEDARKVIIVPGYGMAVSQAQGTVRDLVQKLEKRGCEVKFGIHPVAGRMPGHMNVLLAEVDIPYDKLLDLDAVNSEFETADVALVIGANDVVNPAARHDKGSPIYGMPILDVDKARTVVVSKRSMAAGYAGVENELFHLPNTLMLFGDAKKRVAELCAALPAA